MSLINIDWSPDDRKLRQFSWAGLAGFSLIGCVAGWKSGCRFRCENMVWIELNVDSTWSLLLA